LGILGLPLGSPRTKCHLDGGPLWPVTKYTIRGKVVASPKSGSRWVLWVCVCSWLIHAPKMFQLRTNQPIVWLCRSVWVSDLLVNLPSPIPKLQHTPLPLKCCEPRSTPQLLFFPLSFSLDSQLSSARSLGVHQVPSKYLLTYILST